MRTKHLLCILYSKHLLCILLQIFRYYSPTLVRQFLYCLIWIFAFSALVSHYLKLIVFFAWQFAKNKKMIYKGTSQSNLIPLYPNFKYQIDKEKVVWVICKDGILSTNQIFNFLPLVLSIFSISQNQFFNFPFLVNPNSCSAYFAKFGSNIPEWSTNVGCTVSALNKSFSKVVSLSNPYTSERSKLPYFKNMYYQICTFLVYGWQFHHTKNKHLNYLQEHSG